MGPQEQLLHSTLIDVFGLHRNPGFLTSSSVYVIISGVEVAGVFGGQALLVQSADFPSDPQRQLLQSTLNDVFGSHRNS